MCRFDLALEVPLYSDFRAGTSGSDPFRHPKSVHFGGPDRWYPGMAPLGGGPRGAPEWEQTAVPGSQALGSDGHPLEALKEGSKRGPKGVRSGKMAYFGC